MTTLTRSQLGILRLAFGRDGNGNVRAGSSKDFRRYFVTGSGSSDYSDCVSMAVQKLMACRPPSEISGEDVVFIVTDAGIAHVDATVDKKTTRNAEGAA